MDMNNNIKYIKKSSNYAEKDERKSCSLCKYRICLALFFF